MLIEPLTTIFLWINPVLKTFDRRVGEHAASNVATTYGLHTAHTLGAVPCWRCKDDDAREIPVVERTLTTLT